MKVRIPCAMCGRDVERYRSQIVGLVYCSKVCTGWAKRHGDLLTCEWCRSSFYRRRGEQTSRRCYCSRDCYMAARADARKPTTYRKRGHRHEHRVVAEEMLGRPLRAGEVVHHRNGDQGDNRPENLQVLASQAEHAMLHAREGRR